jgi:hypothetical protein
MITIPSTRTAPWAICHRSCFGKEDRQLKTADGTEIQGQDHRHTSSGDSVDINFKNAYNK